MGRTRRITAAAALGLLLLAGRASADPVIEDGVVTRVEAAPKRLQGVDVIEHLDAALPLELPFTDTQGRSVTLRDYVTGDRPVIFTLNYSDCPMLCSLQLSGMVTALKEIDWTAGGEFDIVTVSLNPVETFEQAKRTQDRYVGSYGRPAAARGWHFLTGSEANIQALAHALGVEYGYNEKRKEYVHPAVLAIATPSGHIARYLYGIEYVPKTLRLSLVEASQGKIGTSVDRIILFCFHYDESEGRYAPVAMNIMRLGGGVTVLGLGAFLSAFWLRQWRKRAGREAASVT
jgi:protein SCO1/2